MSPHLSALLGAATLAVACVSSPALAETTTTCTMITSLPATLTGQGKYCLNRNLSTAMISGAAITVATNNITIDCNDRMVAGTAPLATTRATGIYAKDRVNITIRNCTLRGFETAIDLTGLGSSGHRIERTLLTGSSRVGMSVEGEGSQILDNRVVDTGGTYPYPATNVYGIVVRGDGGVIQDNFVADLVPSQTDQSAYGIQIAGQRNVIAHNRVFDIAPNRFGQAIGIDVGPEAYSVARENAVLVRGYGASRVSGHGLYFDDSEGSRNYLSICMGNFSLGFAPSDPYCTNSWSLHQ